MKNFQFYRNIIALAVIAVFCGTAVVYADFIRTEGALGFGYGYGYDTETLEYGYGYGYHDADTDPENRELYGFPGGDGVATDISTETTCSAATISYTSDYLAEHRVGYGLVIPGDVGTTDWTDFESSGENSIELTDLDESTEYVYVVGSRDAGGNLWPSDQNTFTTDECSSGGAVSSGSIPKKISNFSFITSIQRAISILTSAGQTVPQVLYDILRSLGADSLSSSSDVVFTKNLFLGSNDAQVKLLQEFLNKKGYTVATEGLGSVGQETNDFGPKTQAAVIKFQKANGITPTLGFFGPVTRALANTMYSQ
jgi:hypothetical protein